MIGNFVAMEELKPGFFNLLIESDIQAFRPGQFLTIWCGEGTISPRPFSIVRQIEHDDLHFQKVLFEAKGIGTAWLSQCSATSEFQVEGPKGNGFGNPAGSRVLLVAGGIGIAPIIAMAEHLISTSTPLISTSTPYEIDLVYGAKTARALLIDELPSPRRLTAHLFTDDGSEGTQGLATDFVLEFLKGVDQIYACGPRPMLAKLAEILGPHNIPCQVALETTLGCGGNGRCFGCAVPRADGKGYFLLCQDGPVFNIAEVNLNELA